VARLVDRLKAVAFDLDGTLVDSLPDLARAGQAMLEALGLRSVPRERIGQFIGDGLAPLIRATLRESVGAEPDEAQLAHASKRFLDFYRQHIFVESRVYPGVREGLDALRARGLALCCTTNKDGALAAPLLAAAGLDEYFPQLFAPRLPTERKPLPHLLHRACDELDVASHELLLVGDSRHDVDAARAAGSPVAVVNYGYGRQADRLRADWRIDSVIEIVEIEDTRSATC
jgi:phosphoglycolate phosphatase